MPKFKISPNLFLGDPELKTFRDFLGDKGFIAYIKQNANKFGLIRNFKSDLNFLNGKVEAGTNSGTIKINNAYGIDKEGRFINLTSIDNVAIQSSSTQFFWIKIKHIYSPIEKGTVSVDQNGNVVGVGTEFRKKLRGQPNFASKIKFYDGNENMNEYEVLSVIDDNNIVLQGFFTAESNLRYSVVGTFPPGVSPPSGDKEPFQYDSAEIEIVPGGINPPNKLEGEEFYLARVRNNQGAMIIEDKRTEFFEDFSSFELNNILTSQNKFISVEAVKWDDEFSTREKNIVEISWGLRSSNWTASNSLRQITIANGVGGVFKRDEIIEPFENGDLDGWRLYFENGTYVNIIDSVIDAGSIKVTLDKLDPSDYNSQEQIFICPNVEKIGIKITSVDGLNKAVYHEETYNVNTPILRKRVLVSDIEAKEIQIQYRHVNFNVYTRYANLNESEYYAESSFDSKGNFLENPNNWVTKNSTLVNDIYTIELIPNQNSYQEVITRIDKGDRFGVRERELSNINTLISLIPGESEFIQRIQNEGNFLMASNQIINLDSEQAKAGNEFFVYLYGPFNDQDGQFTYEIRQDYVNAGNPGTLIYTIDSESLAKGNIILHFAYSEQEGFEGWKSQRYDFVQQESDIGEMRLFSGTTTGKFDSTGKGISSRWIGWAICNGQNGTPDLRKTFLSGYDPADSNWQMGALTGQNSKQITVANLPEFNLNVRVTTGQVQGGGGTGSSNVGFRVLPIDDGTNTVNTSSIGENQAFDVTPRRYSMAIVMKIE